MAHRVLKTVSVNIRKFLTAEGLMTDLAKIHLFGENYDRQQLIQYLEANSFDVGIVKRTNGEYGYVLLDEIKSQREGEEIENIRTIKPLERIEADSSVESVINKFNEGYYLFVFHGQKELRGIITYADLNKAPISTFCYVAISVFERLLRKVVERLYGNEKWLRKLSDKNQHDIGGTYVSGKAKEIELSLLECTTLTHLKEILQGDGLCVQSLGYGSKRDFKETMGKLISWRNMIMHSRTIIRGKDGGKDLFRFIDDLGKQMQAIRDWLDQYSGPQNSDNVLRYR